MMMKMTGVLMRHLRPRAFCTLDASMTIWFIAFTAFAGIEISAARLLDIFDASFVDSALMRFAALLPAPLEAPP